METDVIELERVAASLVKEHGSKARAIAQQKMMQAMAGDDPKTAGFWMAVVQFLDKQPSSSAH